MYKRNVLIVDDNDRIANFYIPQYEEIAGRLREESEGYRDYELVFDSVQSINAAKEYLRQGNIVDVLIIDYRFNNSDLYQNGADLVKYVRENSNKHCRVIFYTMHEVSDIPNEDMVNLINSQIFRLVDKGRTSEAEFIRTIYEAAVDCDVIVASMEHFMEEYSELLEQCDYTFMGEQYKISDIITHIRMDDQVGRSIVDKLLYKALIDSVEY